MIKRPKTKRKYIAAAVRILVLSLIALTILIPFYVIIITSLKKSNALAIKSPFVWFPPLSDLSLRAYGNLFTTYTVKKTGYSLIVSGILNTFKIMVPCLTVGMFCSSISAFAFAKLRFPHKKLLFALLLGSMMLPGVVLIVPQYLIYDTIGWVNTLLPVMVPGMFGSAMAVFFLRQYYAKIPDSVIEAAKIDGLGFFGIYVRIILPLAAPGLIAQTVMGFIGILNDYIGPLIYLQTEDQYTLQVALQMFTGGNNQDLPVIMAGAFFAMLPSFLIYILAQKYFIEGITFSGLKE